MVLSNLVATLAKSSGSDLGAGTVDCSLLRAFAKIEESLVDFGVWLLVFDAPSAEDDDDDDDDDVVAAEGVVAGSAAAGTAAISIEAGRKLLNDVAPLAAICIVGTGTRAKTSDPTAVIAVDEVGAGTEGLAEDEIVGEMAADVVVTVVVGVFVAVRLDCFAFDGAAVMLEDEAEDEVGVTAASAGGADDLDDGVWALVFVDGAELPVAEKIASTA